MYIIIDNQLCCTANITTVARSCRFALYNICRIRPFLTWERERAVAQLLVQALVISRLDYCNSLDSRFLLLDLCKFFHVTPLFCHLHWLPVVACIRFKTMVLAYKVVDC